MQSVTERDLWPSQRAALRLGLARALSPAVDPEEAGSEAFRRVHQIIQEKIPRRRGENWDRS